MRYFYDDGIETKEFKHGIRTIAKAEAASMFPGKKALRNDGYSVLIGIIDGRYYPVTRKIDYVEVRPKLHKCDSRCLHGKCGGRCECQCGGANHGKGG